MSGLPVATTRLCVALHSPQRHEHPPPPTPLHTHDAPHHRPTAAIDYYCTRARKRTTPQARGASACCCASGQLRTDARITTRQQQQGNRAPDEALRQLDTPAPARTAPPARVEPVACTRRRCRVCVRRTRDTTGRMLAMPGNNNNNPAAPCRARVCASGAGGSLPPSGVLPPGRCLATTRAPREGAAGRGARELLPCSRAAALSIDRGQDPLPPSSRRTALGKRERVLDRAAGRRARAASRKQTAQAAAVERAPRGRGRPAPRRLGLELEHGRRGAAFQPRTPRRTGPPAGRLRCGGGGGTARRPVAQPLRDRHNLARGSRPPLLPMRAHADAFSAGLPNNLLLRVFALRPWTAPGVVVQDPVAPVSVGVAEVTEMSVERRAPY